MNEPGDVRYSFIFPVPFVTQQWRDTAAMNEGLKAAIFAREAETGTLERSNVGGWHSSSDLPQWAGEAGRELTERVKALVTTATVKLLQTYNKAAESSWSLTMWANVNRGGDYNLLHIHPGNTWSGVYYVDAGDDVPDRPNSGMISFVNPNLAATSSFFSHQEPHQEHIKPVTGTVLMFPSYLQHFVQPYFGERPRISIAFNARRQPFP